MPRSFRVVPFLRSGGPAHRPRRRARRGILAALTALALLAPAAVPTPAHAVVDRESYMACVNAVGAWTDQCREQSGIVGDVLCIAAGTAGILGCAVAEIIEILGKGISLQ